MALTNPARLLAPTANTSISVSTTTGETARAVTGPGWYSFRAVDVTCFLIFGSTSGVATAVSTDWEIPAGQREDYYVREQDKFFKVMGTGAGKLKYRRSGG